MDNYKLRIKIGSNEFEAEGDKDAVMAQFEIFKDLIKLQPSTKEVTNTQTEELPKDTIIKDKDIEAEHLGILYHDDKQRIVSLRIQPQKSKRHIADAVLLILLGYRLLRSEEQILVTQVKNALRQSGIVINRVDKHLTKDIKDGLILKSGMRKGVSYRLTNSGMAKAQEMIKSILEQVI